MISSFDEANVKIDNIHNNLFRNFREKDGYEVRDNVKWGTSESQMIFTFGIKKNNIYIAFCDFLIVPFSWIPKKNFAFNNTPVELYVVFNAAYNKYEYVHRSDSQITKQTDSIEDIIEEIKKIGDATKSKDESSPLQSPISEDMQLVFCTKQFKYLDPSWSREQLGYFKEDKICRYTSLESLFSSIKFKTIRMNGLPGMNDNSEGLYAWNILYENKNTDIEILEKRKRLLNNAFIVSYSVYEKRDDLNQWRIYGDQAKGVCCIYKIDKTRLKDRFFLHKVKYVDKYGDGDDNSLLNKLKKYAENASNQLNYDDLSPIIFFFKPKPYDNEKEVRLLIDNKTTPAYNAQPYKREWQLTNSNNIPNPYIDIPYDEFPLILEEIILGPSMNDAFTIQVQLQELLQQNGFTDVKVRTSEIESYRNPIK